MERAHYAHRHLDVACELDAAGLGRRGAEWRELRDKRVADIEVISGGVRMWLAPSSWAAADDLARREAECCGFLDIEVVEESGRVRLDITSPNADARAVIDALAGVGTVGS